MIRHIFIGTFKEGINEEIKQKQLAYLKAMKEKIPVIVALEAGFSKGWTGGENQVMVTADVETKENLKPSSFVVTQFEY